LDQLDEEQVTYDMREKLSGNVRQSVIASDYDDTDGNGIGPANNVAGTFYVYDQAIGLTANAHNGQKMFLTAGQAGNIKVKTGPYADVVTPSAAPMLVDVYTNDIGDLWTEDDDKHIVSDGADFTVDYKFKTWVTDSSQYVAASITGARVYV
jgi:hypothetical protein